MNKQSKNWTFYVLMTLKKEDQALKQLKQQRGIQKWCVISKTMEEQFKIIGKTGKRCRDRYFHHLDNQLKKQSWTDEQSSLLEKLHNEKGNKWMEISKVLKRSDNDVKNHFHSKLRRAIRKINYFSMKYMKNEFRPLKNNIISKMLKNAQNYYVQQSKQTQTSAKYCFDSEMKNQIFSYLRKQGKEVENELPILRKLIKDINHFNKVSKKKKYYKIEADKTEKCQMRYKGKEILRLIDENKNKDCAVEEEKSQQSEEEDEFSIEDENSPEVVNNLEPSVFPAKNPHCHHSSMTNIIRPSVTQFPYPYSFLGSTCYPFTPNYFPLQFPYIQGNMFGYPQEPLEVKIQNLTPKEPNVENQKREKEMGVVKIEKAEQVCKRQEESLIN